MGSPYSPDFPKSTIAAGPRTTHYAAQGRRANIVFSLEMEREEGEGGWVLAATSAPPAGSACIRYKEARAQLGALRGCMYMWVNMYMSRGFFVFERKNAGGDALDALVGNHNVSLCLNWSCSLLERFVTQSILLA